MKTDTTYKPVFDFQIVFDTDFGIMSLISAEMKDIDIFNHKWISEHSVIKDMIKALYERKERNPLIQCTLSDDTKEIDELYKSFIEDEEYYAKVLERSNPTEMYNLIERCFIMGDVSPYIAYESDLELKFMKNFSICNRIPESNFVKVNDILMYPKRYSSIFNLYYCKHNEGKLLEALASLYSYAKTFYIADYPFNNDEGPGTVNLNNETMEIIVGVNRSLVRSIDIYNRELLETGVNPNIITYEDDDDDSYIGGPKANGVR